MADDYGTCPNDVFDDERLEGAPLSSITGYVVLIMLADDHGLFDANSRVLARRLGCGAPEVSALLADLSERRPEPEDVDALVAEAARLTAD